MRASIWTFLLLAVISTTTHAANWRWLKDTPISHFTEEDMGLLQQTASSLLETGTTGAKASWSNDVTGNSGDIEVLGSETHSGMTCRKSRIINRTAKGLEASGIYTLCKDETGEWKLYSAGK